MNGEGRHQAGPPINSAAASIARAPDWTPADQAELDALIWALVRGVLEHREDCDICRAGFPPCPYIGEAIEAVLDWRSFRHLLSKAEWLRRDLDELNLVTGAALREAA
jgi:hypothetical protein